LPNKKIQFILEEKGGITHNQTKKMIRKQNTPATAKDGIRELLEWAEHTNLIERNLQNNNKIWEDIEFDSEEELEEYILKCATIMSLYAIGEIEIGKEIGTQFLIDLIGKEHPQYVF
jgi:hypothetical protein